MPVFECLKWLPVIIIRISLRDEVIRLWFLRHQSVYRYKRLPLLPVLSNWLEPRLCRRSTFFPFHSTGISVLSIQLFTPVDITIFTMVRLYCATLLLRARKERSLKLGKASTSLLSIKKARLKVYLLVL